jgi:hypothetical protein
LNEGADDRVDGGAGGQLEGLTEALGPVVDAPRNHQDAVSGA